MKYLVILLGVLIIGALAWIGVIQSGMDIPEPPMIAPKVNFSEGTVVQVSRRLAPELLAPLSPEQSPFEVSSLKEFRNRQPSGSNARKLCDLWLVIAGHRRKALMQMRKVSGDEMKMEKTRREWATYSSIWSRQILELENAIGQ